jgi:hypothetical protein
MRMLGFRQNLDDHSCHHRNKSKGLPQMRLPKWSKKVMDPSNQMASAHSLVRGFERPISEIVRFYLPEVGQITTQRL